MIMARKGIYSGLCKRTLSNAQAGPQDEFYAQLADIANELKDKSGSIDREDVKRLLHHDKAASHRPVCVRAGGRR